MPQFTPATKVTRTASWGAKVVLHGETLAEAAAHADALAAETGLVFVHPYDDPGVIAGQGTLALELLQDAPDLDALVIPVGGGGLLAGCAVAATGDAAGHRGVRRRGRGLLRDGAAPRRRDRRRSAAPTIAEGIAVRDIGEMPLAIIRELGVEVLVVPEHAIEEAIGLLAEGAKVVAEGAGAAGRRGAAGLPGALPRQARRHRRSPAATSTRASCPMCCCATCCATAGCCGCICRSPTGPACWPTSPARSATPAATSSRSRTSACSPRSSVQAAELEVMVEARDPAHADAILEALEADLRGAADLTGIASLLSQ